MTHAATQATRRVYLAFAGRLYARCMTNPSTATSRAAVSIPRRNALRACYLLMVVGLGATAWPRLLTAAPDRPLMDGVVDAVLCGLQLLAMVGLFSPVRMLTVLVFDVLWKVIWVAAVAIPRWVDHTVDADVTETLFAAAWAIPFVVIIPWRVVVAEVLRRGEPWRRADS